MEKKLAKILIFASGNGSNFEAIINYFRKDNSFHFELLTDIKNAGVIERAKKLGVKWHYVSFKDTYDFLSARKGEFDLCVLAGYMRILPEKVLNLGKFINIHPSLLPKFKGMNAIEQAYVSGDKETGVTVHFVTSEVDSGEIIVQKTVNIADNMTLDALEAIIHKVEHEIYPAAIQRVLGVSTVVGQNERIAK